MHSMSLKDLIDLSIINPILKDKRKYFLTNSYLIRFINLVLKSDYPLINRQYQRKKL